MSESPRTLCRIQGLTSPRGQKLNGLAASFDPTAAPSNGRLAVRIDGEPALLSIKSVNLHELKPVQDLAVLVKRNDLRSDEFMAAVIDQTRGQRIITA